MNLILFDWLSFTSADDDFESILTLLGLDVEQYSSRFTKCKGRYFYKDGFQFGGISIYANGNKDKQGRETVCCQLTGQGCRDFETFSTHKDWLELLGVLCSDPDVYNITRLDIAYDDHDGLLDIWKIKEETDKLNFVTLFRCVKPEYDVISHSITIGYGKRHQSDVYMRCYDKAVERSCDPGTHWIRFEIEMHKDRAFNFAREYVSNAGRGIGAVFFGVLNTYLRYVIPSDDSNKSRWSTASWWLDFCDDVQKISLTTLCDQDYNLLRLGNYIMSIANPLKAYIKLFGTDGLVKTLDHSRVKPKIKYDIVVKKELERRHLDFQTARDQSGDVLETLEKMGLA